MYYWAIFVLSTTPVHCPSSCLFMIPPELKISAEQCLVFVSSSDICPGLPADRPGPAAVAVYFSCQTGYFPTFCDKRSTISSGPRALINNVEETVNRESFRDKLYFVRCPHSPGVMRYAQVGVTGNIVHSSARSLSQDTALTHESMFPFRSQYK